MLLRLEFLKKKFSCHTKKFSCMARENQIPSAASAFGELQRISPSARERENCRLRKRGLKKW